MEPIESGLGQDDMAGSSTKVVTSGDEAFTPAVQLQKHTSVHVSYLIHNIRACPLVFKHSKSL